jgi:hypothetical protein
MYFQHSRLFNIFTCSCTVLALLITDKAANAQGVSTPTATIHTVTPGPVVNIGTPTGPIPVDLDINGGPWTKSIGDPNNVVSGVQTLDIIETLVNAGTETWTDWHEIMLSPPVGVVQPVWTNVVSLHVNNTAISYTATGINSTTLDLFNFSQPVLPGDIFTIHKQTLVASSILQNGSFLRIQEYPTTVPEPTALALVAIGGIAMFHTRRRR